MTTMQPNYAYDAVDPARSDDTSMESEKRAGSKPRQKRAFQRIAVESVLVALAFGIGITIGLTRKDRGKKEALPAVNQGQGMWSDFKFVRLTDVVCVSYQCDLPFCVTLRR